MADNITKPTDVSTETFLSKVSHKRRDETRILMEVMRDVSGDKALMWGPSIIGFGSRHYSYESGREIDTPALSFSPREKAITLYFNEGFDAYDQELSRLGKYTCSKGCLYVSHLNDIDMEVLTSMLKKSLRHDFSQPTPVTVETYLASLPTSSRQFLDQLRELVHGTVPNAKEVMSYGIIGYKIDEKRARVFISGWKDHVAMYPIPKDSDLQKQLKPYIKGKGTLWFPLSAPLPTALIKKTIRSLVR